MVHKQPKSLKVAPLKSGGVIATIYDNDGTTIIKEWFTSSQDVAVKETKQFLEETYGPAN